MQTFRKRTRLCGVLGTVHWIVNLKMANVWNKNISFFLEV